MLYIYLIVDIHYIHLYMSRILMGSAYFETSLMRTIFNKLKLNSFINGVNFILSDTQVYHCDIQTGMLEDTA